MFPSLPRFVLVASLALAALAAPDAFKPTRTARDLANPLNPVDIVARHVPLAPRVHLTNAQRLSRGLPPNRPRSRANRALKARQSSTCQQRTGLITVAISQPDGSVRNAFLGPPNAFGEFQPTDSRDDSLSVSFCIDPTTTYFDINTLNGFSDFPVLAAILGFASVGSDLGPGSLNYAYIGASTTTPRGPAVTQPNSFSAAAAVPEGVETPIWRIEDAPNGNTLVPSWVNPDGSEPTLAFLYVPSGNAFVITGDAAAFAANFGAGQPVTFSFSTN